MSTFSHSISNTRHEEPPKTLYERLPQSWREQQLQVRAVEDDQEFTKQNQEAVKSKSVAELAEIGGLSDFPIPEVIENVLGTSRRPRPVERKKRFREMYVAANNSVKIDIFHRFRKWDKW